MIDSGQIYSNDCYATEGQTDITPFEFNHKVSLLQLINSIYHFYIRVSRQHFDKCP
jgi:hypothetical protein